MSENQRRNFAFVAHSFRAHFAMFFDDLTETFALLVRTMADESGKGGVARTALKEGQTVCTDRPVAALQVRSAHSKRQIRVYSPFCLIIKAWLDACARARVFAIPHCSLVNSRNNALTQL